MNLLGFLNLRGISGQIAALVAVSIITIHLILAATFLIYRPDKLDPWMENGQSQFPLVIQLLGATPAVDRPALIANIARALPQLHIESLPLGSAHAAEEPLGLNPHNLHRRL